MECYHTSAIPFRVIFSSAADTVDSDDKEEYSEGEGCRNDWDDDDDDILVTQSWRHHPLCHLKPAGTIPHLIADKTRVFSCKYVTIGLTLLQYLLTRSGDIRSEVERYFWNDENIWRPLSV